MDVILPAGSLLKRNDPLLSLSQGGYKELIMLAGKPMIQWVLDAISESRLIDRVVLTGLPITSDLHCDHPLKIVDSHGGLLENIREGARVLSDEDPNRPVMVLSGDLPLLTPAAVDWMVSTSQDRDIDLFFPLIERKLLEQRCPRIHKAFVHTRDYELGACDGLVARVSLVASDLPLVKRIVEARQDPMRQAAIVGYDTMLLLMIHRLSLSEVEAQMDRRLGIRSRLILCPFPEFAMDVDKPGEYEWMQNERSGVNT